MARHGKAFSFESTVSLHPPYPSPYRHLTKPDEAVVVLGMHAFRDTKLNLVRAYMDTDWGMRTVAFAGSFLFKD